MNNVYKISNLKGVDVNNTLPRSGKIKLIRLIGKSDIFYFHDMQIGNKTINFSETITYSQPCKIKDFACDINVMKGDNFKLLTPMNMKEIILFFE